LHSLELPYTALRDYFLNVLPISGSIGPHNFLNDLTQSFYLTSNARQGPSVIVAAILVN